MPGIVFNWIVLCGQSTERSEKMKVFAITCGEKKEMVNPGMTEAGLAEVRLALQKLSFQKIQHVVIGTGARFSEIFQLWLKYANPGLPLQVHYYALLGSADTKQKTSRGSGFCMQLADGTKIDLNDYTKLGGGNTEDIWLWLEARKEGTLLCTGHEFMEALGVKYPQMAEVYVIDTETREIRVLKE